MADRLREITEREFECQLKINLNRMKKEGNNSEYKRYKKFKKDYETAKEKYDLFYMREGDKIWYVPERNHHPSAETHRNW